MRANESGQSALLLLDVIEVLNKYKVEYAVIGAFAVSFYGAVRASLDADAVISFEDTNDIKPLCLTFEHKDLNVDYRQGDAEDPVKGVINIRDSFGNRVDLLFGIRGMKDDVFERVKKSEFMGSVVNLIGLEDLVAMKIFAGSPKDIHDVAGVLEISGDKIDKPLLRKLAGGYGQNCLKTLSKILKDRS